MTDPLDRVLRLVAEGRLTAEEAAPILEALDRTPQPADKGQAAADAGAPHWARIEVREGGRRVVDLRIPISLGRAALTRVPGLSREQIADVEAAVTTGTRGPILDVQDPNGDGVRIILE